jgi:hypothetical protein
MNRPVAVSRFVPAQRLADKLGFVVGAMIVFSGAAIMFAQSVNLGLLATL